MKRNPRDLVRYNASERANHWVVGICFILLALSGLAFFHPAFFWLTNLFGGGPWTRILHPYIGVVMGAFFVIGVLPFGQLTALALCGTIGSLLGQVVKKMVTPRPVKP